MGGGGECDRWSTLQTNLNKNETKQSNKLKINFEMNINNSIVLL